MNSALETVLRELNRVDALRPDSATECGLGKLCLQLLSFAALEDPQPLTQLFGGIEQIASPVLTMILDVPWPALAQSGWPLFGLLGQLNLRKVQHVPGALNSDSVDGLDDPAGLVLREGLRASL